MKRRMKIFYWVYAGKITNIAHLLNLSLKHIQTHTKMPIDLVENIYNFQAYEMYNFKAKI
jgi:hypothetical protein